MVTSGRGLAADFSAEQARGWEDVQMTQVTEIAGGDIQVFL